MEGYTAVQINEALSGIHCGRRPASRTDQSAIAATKAYEEVCA
ncbi:MAG: TSCPD domain-containing protein [Clostridiales Family XIII bacterium]|nr:TSCPD domain-containing protein [Clostridiales Family XIII bacterium]